MKKRILSMFLVLILLISIFSCFTITVSADDGGGGGTSFGTTEYYTPDGYTNVTVIYGYDNHLIIFSKPDDIVYGDGNGGFYTQTSDGESSDLYYMTSTKKTDWNVCNDLYTESKVESAKLTTKVSGYYYYVLVGEIQGSIKTNYGGSKTGSTIYTYLDTNYHLTKTNKDGNYNTYKHYNVPEIMQNSGEYVIFKRSSDTKYTVLFYDTSSIGSYEYEDYLKIGISGENTLRVNSETQYIQLDTVQQCLDYIFDDEKTSQRAQKYNISLLSNTNGLSTSSDRIINGFDGSEEIINTTLDIQNSDGSIRHFSNPASHSDWYYAKYGEEYEDTGYKMVGDYYFIYKAPAYKKGSNVINPELDPKIPQDKDGWTYILMSSKTDNGGIINVVGSTLLQMLLTWEYPIELDGLLPKYALFNTDDDSTTAYYFSSLDKAISFTLYGSKVSEPEKTEKATWAYNIAEIFYNNYWLGNDKWGVNPIPEHLYKHDNKQVEIELKQYNTEYRLKIVIENFQPYGVLISSTKKLQISTSQTVKFYEKYDGYEWEPLDLENANFNPYKLQLYFKDMSDPIGSWLITKSSITIDGIQNSDGSITIDQENAPVVRYEKTDGSGDELILDKNSGMGFVNGEHKYNYDEEIGQWVDKDTGEILNPDEWQSDYEDWLEKRDVDIQSSLKKFNTALKNLLDLFKRGKNETSELNKLLKNTFGKLPIVFSMILGMAILGIIIIRFIKRGG